MLDASAACEIPGENTRTINSAPSPEKRLIADRKLNSEIELDFVLYSVRETLVI
jgi:hypothetical protein